MNKENLKKKLVSRVVETRAGNQQEQIEMVMNVKQAEIARDGLAKSIYYRLFDYLVTVNKIIMIYII